MNCPACGHVMNHHADKLLWDAVELQDEAGPQMVAAYSCPHCGANAGKIVNHH